uniref:Uncharacterized protein n=1 Tax=Aegilops tauschii subsp. strangulata TaxID=200361 RepID=A0A453H577_AEGTS
SSALAHPPILLPTTPIRARSLLSSLPPPPVSPMAMRPPSFFGGLRARELSGGRGSARASAARLPYLSDLSSDPGDRGCGVISVEHSGDAAIPFAVSFCKVR